MDRQTYEQKLEHIFKTRERSLNTIYQWLPVSKKWKIVNRRCNTCNRGFNQNTNDKFTAHICKPSYNYNYV